MKKTIFNLFFFLILINLAHAERIYIVLPNGDGTWCTKTECWYEYDSNGNKIHYKHSEGHEEWWTYDSKNNVIEHKSDFFGGTTTLYSYNKKGLLYKKKSISKYGESEYYYEYDNNGNIIHYKTSFKGDEYYAKYDEAGRLLYKEDAYGNKIYELIEEYDDNGNLVHYKDEKKEYWKEYDKKGNLIYYNGDYTEYWCEYNENNQLIYKKENQYEEWYDNKGRIIHERRPGGPYWYGNEADWINYPPFETWIEYSDDNKSKYSKDSDGFEIWETFDEKGNPLTYKDTNERKTIYKYKYDSNGNIIYSEKTESYYDDLEDKEVVINIETKQYDSEGRETYNKSTYYDCEEWTEYDKFGNTIHYKLDDKEDDEIYEEWYKYNENNKLIFYKNSYGSKQEYDSSGNLLYEVKIEPID